MDDPPMQYKVLFYVGDSIDLKTKGETGTLTWEGSTLLLTSDRTVKIPIASITGVEFFRMHGVGSMIKIALPDGAVFVSVIWWQIGGYFASVNSLKTRELCRRLKEKTQSGDR